VDGLTAKHGPGAELARVSTSSLVPAVRSRQRISSGEELVETLVALADADLHAARHHGVAPLEGVKQRGDHQPRAGNGVHLRLRDVVEVVPYRKRHAKTDQLRATDLALQRGVDEPSFMEPVGGLPGGALHARQAYLSLIAGAAHNTRTTMRRSRQLSAVTGR
jgi:hypothetical protein